MKREPIRRYLDAAVLKPETTRDDAEEAIRSMAELGTRTVCVRPCDIPKAVELCRGKESVVSCVLSFPHGDALTESKADEAKRYVELGVAEIDMVSNYGYILSGIWEAVERDIASVREAAGRGVLLKVILETCLLNREQIARATETAIVAGADFVKTSTGFAAEGASVEAVKIMLDTVAGRIQVKASGGIRDMSRALEFVEMGCARLGVNSTTAALLCSEDKDESS